MITSYRYLRGVLWRIALEPPESTTACWLMRTISIITLTGFNVTPPFHHQNCAFHNRNYSLVNCSLVTVGGSPISNNWAPIHQSKSINELNEM